MKTWNYGKQKLRGQTGATDTKGRDIYFSYKTVVAFCADELFCVENLWGQTTGKHLNWIQPDKKKRLSASAFAAAYQAEFGEQWNS